MPPMSVTDDDAGMPSLTYSLRGFGSDLFDIVASSGVIQQKKPGSLDSEVNTEYNLTVHIYLKLSQVKLLSEIVFIWFQWH